MEAIGSEVGIKMRSAIKAKLMELGCYVDDELPDYVMVMVANKRTRSQMEDDLQLFLSNNTEAFVCWLHQVLQKLQEVTINTKLVIPAEINKKAKTKQSPNHGKKEHKEKKKSKDKLKLKKSKKDKSKKSDSETPKSNVPKLLIDLEQESPPSITDIFAGQILKSHGILTSSVPYSDDGDKKDVTCNIEEKTKRKLIRTRFPVIDPSTVPLITDNLISIPTNEVDANSFDIALLNDIKKNELTEVDTFENKKHNELDSDDEDFINLGTEAEDLISVGLHDDISTKNKEKPRAYTPPLTTIATTVINKPINTLAINSTVSNMRQPIKSPENVLPQIELNLPKRPLRERLGIREDPNKSTRVNYTSAPQISSKISICNPSKKEEDNIFKRISSRLNFDRNGPKSVICNNQQEKSIKSRLLPRDKNADNNDNRISKKRIGSRIVSVQAESNKNNPSPITVASVVRAPPRPPNLHGITAAPQLLLRAMADAQKSLLNMPPKIDTDRNLKKKSIPIPSRRNIKPQKIIIEVPTDNIPTGKSENHDSNSDFEIDMDTESLGEFESDRDAQSLTVSINAEYVPEPLKNKLDNTKIAYIPTHINSNDKSDTQTEPGILNDCSNRNNILQKNPQFVVTLDGLDPNVFLEKKLEMMEKQDNKNEDKSPTSKSSNCPIDGENNVDVSSNRILTEAASEKMASDDVNNSTSADSKKSQIKSDDSSTKKVTSNECTISNTPKKRKGSPIVFSKDDKKLIKTTVKIDNSANKYDSLPSLPPDKHRTPITAVPSRERCRFYPECRLGTACEFYHSPSGNPVNKQNSICRAFPACTFGDKCVYAHPPCKFNQICVRKDCPYSHNEKAKTKSAQAALTMPPSIASHVVPASNYKTVSSLALPPICKYHPNCSNSGCHWYHPKPCRFGKFCLNKVECNFYHHNIPSLKWKSTHQA